jgi:hypothetical protein
MSQARNLPTSQQLPWSLTFATTSGFRVLRFWNNEVLGNLEGVLTVFAAELSGAPPHPARASRGRPSPPRGEGTERPRK